jgi:hypothetical protein
MTTRLLPIAVLLLALLAASAPAGPPVSAGGAADPVTWWAPTDTTVRITGGEAFAPVPGTATVDCGGGVAVPSRLIAQGALTVLGRTASDITTESCVANEDGTLSLAGRVVHHAADGDELHATWTGTLADGTEELAIAIRGGTGRFRRAQGNARGRATLNPVTGAGSYEVDGTLSWEAGDRSAAEGQAFTAELTATTTDMKCTEPRCVATSTFEARCAVPSTWVIRFSLEGTSEALGSVRGWAEHCSQVAWAGPGVPEYATYGDGVFELTLADGSTISGTYTGGLGSEGEGGVVFQDSFTFTGGTGRYRNVRGAGVEYGTTAALDAPMPMRMEGWIRY